jgi:hypothetical protein
VLGEQLFPSETVLLENSAEVGEDVAAIRSVISGEDLRAETELWAR